MAKKVDLLSIPLLEKIDIHCISSFLSLEALIFFSFDISSFFLAGRRKGLSRKVDEDAVVLFGNWEDHAASLCAQQGRGFFLLVFRSFALPGGPGC